MYIAPGVTWICIQAHTIILTNGRLPLHNRWMNIDLLHLPREEHDSTAIHWSLQFQYFSSRIHLFRRCNGPYDVNRFNEWRSWMGHRNVRPSKLTSSISAASYMLPSQANTPPVPENYNGETDVNRCKYSFIIDYYHRIFSVFHAYSILYW